MFLRSNVKLNKIIRLYLTHKGKKDAKKKIIFIEGGENLSPSCPFFKEEIALCLSKIHRDRARYARHKEKYQGYKNLIEKKIDRFVLEIDTLEVQKKSNLTTLEKLDELSFEINKKEIQPFPLPGEEDLPDGENTIREFRIIEARAPMEVEKAKATAKKELLNESISSTSDKVKKINNKVAMLRAIEIRKRVKLKLKADILTERCKQYYSLTIARLSAYWEGVLQMCEDKEKMSSQFYTQNVFEELYEEIEKLTVLQKEWEE